MRKVLLYVLIAVLLLGVVFAYMNYRNRQMSPPAEQRITTDGGLTVRINYSRPSLRGRLIFGPEEEDALQPFGVYWRLGANEATVFEFSEDVSVNDVVIPTGSYGAYAVPGPDSFKVGINTDWDRWGVSEPDYEKDLVTMMVPIEQLNERVEQFTIRLGETDKGVKIICEWDDVRFVIPVKEI